MNDVSVEILKGKTLTTVVVNKNKTEIKFTTSHNQPNHSCMAAGVA